MVLRFGLIIAAGLLLFPGLWLGCSTSQEIPRDASVEKFDAETDKSEEIERLNQKLMDSAQMDTDPGDYLLGPGDLLHITVFEAPELETKARVSSRGDVSVPLLGLVHVEDLTAREAEVHIEDKYREKYIKDPHVTVFVEEHHSQRISLVGEIKNPGTYDYPSKMRLLDVLALGGGLTIDAGRIAQVRRMGDSEEQYGVMIVDLDKLIGEGFVEFNIEINGGDIIFVPKAGVFFVDGAVRKPGSYPIKQETTVMEAIVSAGGFQLYANKQQATLVQYLESGEREVKELNLLKAEHQSITLNDRDVLIVKSNVLKQMALGFRIWMTPAGVAFGYYGQGR